MRIQRGKLAERNQVSVDRKVGSIKILFGAWNMRIMFEVSKSEQVTDIMHQYDIDILVINECLWWTLGGWNSTRTTQNYT